MRTKVLAGAAALVLLVGIAVFNSRRAAHQRIAVPPPPTSVPAPAPPPNLDSLSCDDWPERSTVEEARAAFAVSRHPDLQAISVRCSDASGQRGPSLVRVIDTADDDRIVATLIRPTQNLHVLAVRADARGVRVTASEAGLPTAGDQKAAADLGSVFTWTFATKDGLHYGLGVPDRVAFACSPSDLALSLTATGATAAAVGLRNRSDRPCAVEGYPQVAAQSVEGALIASVHRMSATGSALTTTGAPAVIVLAPGHSARAVIDSSDRTPADGATICSRLSALTVGLPTGELLGTMPLRMRSCTLQVHPLIAA
ncbi:DUF4232 domain-containing protein [Jatrophihabitans telluris]|uniref:DUF4232 domain-containing protein n=1 Tax=Jatrophihabitans telluris TaxID=2038343 RepID=A0ABY4QXH4_9ACTN|nr:DUF4232 domain-containing protein [Jatrophihabitans telluris]UQX87907.1 DUF4232 domain-containing protein [Jatrophihabitans telluris]